MNMNNRKLFWQIFHFVWIGGVAFLIDYGTFLLSYSLFHFPLLVANTLGFCISLWFNYEASKRLVFQMTANRSNLKFIILSTIGLGVNNVCMMIFLEHFLWNATISKVLSTGITLVYNFISKKIILEKNPEGVKGDEETKKSCGIDSVL